MATQYVVKCVEDSKYLASIYQGPNQYTQNKNFALRVPRQKADELVHIFTLSTRMSKTFVVEES